MSEETLTDTKEKIIVKDHDILIQLTTQMTELLRRFDDNIRYQQDSDKTFAVEMKGVAMEQVRVASELKSLQKEQGEFQLEVAKRLERLETKSNIWDVVNSFGVLVSAYVGYVFGGSR